MCKERKFFISCWVATMAAVQPLKITAMLLVQCENHFDTLHKYILHIFIEEVSLLVGPLLKRRPVAASGLWIVW
jgi:hypothetical protein